MEMPVEPSKKKLSLICVIRLMPNPSRRSNRPFRGLASAKSLLSALLSLRSQCPERRLNRAAPFRRFLAKLLKRSCDRGHYSSEGYREGSRIDENPTASDEARLGFGSNGIALVCDDRMGAVACPKAGLIDGAEELSSGKLPIAI